MTKLVYLWILLAVATTAAEAQPLQGKPSKAWLELASADGQNPVIKAWFENGQELDRQLKFVLEVEKEDEHGLQSLVQGNEFSVGPKRRLKLAQKEIANKKLYYIRVRFRIFDQQQQLISADSLVQEQPSRQSSTSNTFTETAGPQSTAVAPDVEPEMGGLIIDDTRSKSGRDFYDIFFKKWIAPMGINDYTIIIKELPSRGRNAQISLEVNSENVLKRFVHPQYDRIEEQANISIRYVRSYLSRQKEAKEELQDDDVDGSGIF
ncbi:MAG: CsgE family curli-type amyloid fiber assembly protein [Bacteroidota bacterium]